MGSQNYYYEIEGGGVESIGLDLWSSEPSGWLVAEKICEALYSEVLWEYEFPIRVTLYDEEGENPVGEYDVELDMIPDFYASAAEPRGE